ncbi:MAG: UvrB/UvrC motif-containing protein [Terriglobales bacterium]
MLTDCIEFEPIREPEILSAIPDVSAVFLLRGHDANSDPYISKTSNLRRRLQRLLGSPTELTKRLNLRDRVKSIEYSCTGSDFESGFLLYRVLRKSFPKTYADRLRFRFAPLIRLHFDNEYPRASVTTKLGRAGGKALYYGPFSSRAAADKFASDSLDLFKMRRCVDDLHPDPAFPGCIYSEMKMCLAPCFKGCTDEEYRSEVARVQFYFDTNGRSMLQEISSERDRASASMEFEAAAASHARLEKVKSVLSLVPEIVHRIDRLAAVMVQASSIPHSVTFFSIQGGCISDPQNFPIQAAEHAKSHSMEARVQEALDNIAVRDAPSALDVMEHLAILKRWYYRSSHAGEIFFRDEKRTLPMRRLVRGISRVYHGETEEQNAN